MRKITAIFISTAIVLTLGACGSSVSKDAGSDSVPTTMQEKSSASATSNSSSEARTEAENAKDGVADDSSSAENASSSSEVTASFKEMMDGYESFMGDYVEFMKKYKSSDNVASMLSDYTEMMQKYTDWAAKIDEVDSDSLSPADSAYYLEVQGRVLQKMSEVS